MTECIIPEISVIMSVYNGDSFLKESMDSMLDQTFKNFEFIIVDDCSTDNTAVILKEYSEKDQRIILIRNSQNAGLTVNLNRMLILARGKYIARIDADDISLPLRLEKQYDYMEKHPDTGVIGSDGRIFGKDRKTIFLERPHTHEEICASLAFENLLIHSSAFIRRSVLEENNIRYDVNLRIIQDYELWTRLCRITKFTILDDELVRYRVSGSNISILTEKKENYRENILKTIYGNYFRTNRFELTDDRLELHVMMLHAKKISGISNLNKISSHLEYLLSENDRTGAFDRNYFRYLISKHWFKTCTRMTKAGLKVFFQYRNSELRKGFSPGISLIIRLFIKCLIRY